MRYRRKVSSYSSSRCFPMDVTIIPAPCLPASSMSNRLIMALLSLSRWLMGSSRKIKSNGWQRLRIKATRCCCPKESLPALSSVLSGMPVASKRARISFFFLWLVRRFFNKTFSRAVSSGKIRSSWKRMLSECFLTSAHSPTYSTLHVLSLHKALRIYRYPTPMYLLVFYPHQSHRWNIRNE